MPILIIAFVLFVLLDIAAMLWGYDSRDGIDSAEWVRRQEWQLSHLAQED
ncbi:MAG: hypothetical protein H0V70_27900 [Ktedonobacteraceae bacterium]|nr:hypothetical protein [Ktedonobacteraceae bacterium]